MKKRYSPLIGAALAAASLFHFSLPAFSLGTEAGELLRNRATATYDDNDNTYEAISNQVTVTVGKIAGITNVISGYDDLTTTNGNVLPGDTVAFNFEITNTGNDTTNIHIPDRDNIFTDNFTVGATQPSGTTFPTGANNASGNTGSIQFRRPGDTEFTDVPASGIITNVPEDTSIIVRVIGTVNSNANINDEIRVRLGDTNDNDFTNIETTQNQPDNDGTSDDQNADVRTETAAPRPNGSTDPTAGATVDGDPINRQREASAIHIVPIGSDPLALTRIRKTNAGVNQSNTPTDLTDDIITYNLELDVLQQKLARYNDFSFTPAALEGRNYTGGSAAANTLATFSNDIANVTNLILISDAIPAGTVLDEAITPASTGGWTPVYTDSPLTTPADNAEWTTTAPANQAARNDVTRVGWVYDAEANNAIATGTTVTAAQGGFTFRVRNTTATGPVNIYNLAQAFGSTDDGAAGVTAGNNTFDESGDENPNNFNDDGTAVQAEIVATTVDESAQTGDLDGDGNTTDTGLDVFGYADPGTGEDNVDVDGNNTAIAGEDGVTPAGALGGEVNKVVISLGAVTARLLNGPDGAAQAEGIIFLDPDAQPAPVPDDNHDFQNLAAPIPLANAQITNVENSNPNAIAAATTVTFTNTVRNTETGDLNNVILEPVTPDALLGTGGVQLDGNADGNDDFLPEGTTVTIEYDTQSVTYTYSQGTPGDSTDGEFTTTSTNPVTIGTLNGTAAGDNEEDYTVIVTLPIGTELSTINNNGGYPVPIVAYNDDDGTTADAPDVDDIYNVTVDQVYLGYLRLTKDVRVLRDIDNNGNTDGNFTVVDGMDYGDPNDAKQPAPGDRIEYRVNYSNISEPQGSGSANGILDAENVTITEDGTGTRVAANNWAQDNNNDSIIDTLHVTGVADDTTSSNDDITFFSGSDGNTPSNDNDRLVTRYVNRVTLVEPDADGAFTFQRKVTEPSDLTPPTP